MDVKTFVLDEDLHEKLYKQQPTRFEEKGKEAMICKLKKNQHSMNCNMNAMHIGIPMTICATTMTIGSR